LHHSPWQSDDHLVRTKYLVFDGSFIWKRRTSAVILLDAETNKLVYGLYDFKENSFRALLDLFQGLRMAGVSPRSCTVDGLPAVIKALADVWPDIIIQRCLFHIQRHYCPNVS